MADRTLYDILEIGRDASHTAVEAAYDRIIERLKTDEKYCGVKDSLEQSAVKEAYRTLGSASRRAAYDRGLDAQWAPAPSGWSFAKVAAVAVLALIAGGLYYQHGVEQARLAEKQMAIAEAKAAEEQAKADAEAAQFRESLLHAQSSALEARQQREQELALRRYTAEQAAHARGARNAEERERLAGQRAEVQRQREEMQANQAAQQQLMRERAVLCQMERERYGRAISCN